MNSREAFEAWCRAEGVDTTLWLKDQPQCGYANARTTDYWVGWQAAIQHARDVAVQGCEYVGMGADAAIRQGAANQYHEGRSDGAAQCAAAIKEALK